MDSKVAPTLASPERNTICWYLDKEKKSSSLAASIHFYHETKNLFVFPWKRVGTGMRGSVSMEAFLVRDDPQFAIVDHRLVLFAYLLLRFEIGLRGDHFMAQTVNLFSYFSVPTSGQRYGSQFVHFYIHYEKKKKGFFLYLKKRGKGNMSCNSWS